MNDALKAPEQPRHTKARLMRELRHLSKANASEEELGRKLEELEAVLQQEEDEAVELRFHNHINTQRKLIMAERESESADAKRKGGGKLKRSEIVTVRLDPRLLYLAELAARKQRRSVSSYIEWAVENSLTAVSLGEIGSSTSISDEASSLWEADESERFIRLAIAHPELMNYEEQQKWIFLRDSPLLAPAKRRDGFGKFYWDREILEDHIFRTVRQYWAAIEAAVQDDGVANDVMAKLVAAYDIGTLFPTLNPPKMITKRTVAPPNFDDLDDEIPFP